MRVLAVLPVGGHMRLGGWSRLGIVISVLFGVLVVFFAYSARPKLEPLQNAWFDEASEAIADAISKAEAKEVPPAQVRKVVINKNSTEAASWLEQVATSPNEKQKLFSEAVAKVNKKYKAQIAALASEQREYWIIAFACWAGGTLLLFSGGWTARWIYLGFRRDAA